MPSKEKSKGATIEAETQRVQKLIDREHPKTKKDPKD